MENLPKAEGPADAMRAAVRFYRREGMFLDPAIPLTPKNLAAELVEKAGPDPKERILVLFNPEFAIELWQLGCRRVTFAGSGDCRVSRLLIEEMMGFEFRLLDDLDGAKFDLAISNPPRREGGRKGKFAGGLLWPRLVAQAVELTEEGGRIAMIHPSGWRGPSKSMAEIAAAIRGMDTRWLSIHSLESGKASFGTHARFDMHVSVRECTPGFKTEVRDERGQLIRVDIKKMPMIPNFDIRGMIRLLASGEEARAVVAVTGFHDMRIGRAAQDRCSKFRYPCFNHAPLRKNGGKPVCVYARGRAREGLFGTPKAMFGAMAGAGRIIVDDSGKYGLSPFAAGVVDSPRNLGSIKAAMESEGFRETMDAFRFSRQEISPAVLRNFRKDFWREFV